MISKVLVANRGEIAVRIIRACREMNIETVAIYSTADKDSLHVKLADEAVCIGKPLPKDSYLNIESIITAAVLTGADAIHPGFGFLSENAKFARICRECNIKFIGPTPEMIELMGDKARARQMMIEADVPVVPGSDGTVGAAEDARVLAKRIGYPVILKAVSGGGGRGMRIVWNESEIDDAFQAVQRLPQTFQVFTHPFRRIDTELYHQSQQVFCRSHVFLHLPHAAVQGVRCLRQCPLLRVSGGIQCGPGVLLLGFSPFFHGLVIGFLGLLDG